MSAAGFTVLLVTSIRLYADEIAQTLRELEAIDVVRVVASCEEAAAALAVELPDVVVLDLMGLDDVEAGRAFVASAAVPVVALGIRRRDEDVLAWAEIGVAGILTRRASLDDLLRAVVTAAQGECGCCPWVASVLLRRVAEAGAERDRRGPHLDLTLREREIGDLLVEGLSNKEIAARLRLGVSTVKNHVHNLLGKIGARTRAEAVATLVAAGDPVPRRARSGSRTRIHA